VKKFFGARLGATAFACGLTAGLLTFVAVGAAPSIRSQSVMTLGSVGTAMSEPAP